MRDFKEFFVELQIMNDLKALEFFLSGVLQ